jgi:hypothetical protein
LKNKKIRELENKRIRELVIFVSQVPVPAVTRKKARNNKNYPSWLFLFFFTKITK